MFSAYSRVQRQVFALIVCRSNATIAVIDEPPSLKYSEEERGRAMDRRPDREEEEIKWGTGTLPVLWFLHSSFSFQLRSFRYNFYVALLITSRLWPHFYRLLRRVGRAS